MLCVPFVGGKLDSMGADDSSKGRQGLRDVSWRGESFLWVLEDWEVLDRRLSRFREAWKLQRKQCCKGLWGEMHIGGAAGG